MIRTRIDMMTRHVFALLLASSVFFTPVHAEAELLQRDWMVTLTEALGLSFGLPDEPEDEDYLAILSGNRTYRLEAEEVFLPTESQVSSVAYKHYGDFSGNGWLHGVSRPAQVTLAVVLPLAGTYEVTTSVRLAGHTFNIGGGAFTVDGGDKFTEVAVGELVLPAGPQTFIIDLPANGSIDYIELRSAALPPLSPRTGWLLDRPLSWDDILTTLTQTWQLASILPSSGAVKILEIEDLAESDVGIVSTPHFGIPSGGRWLRATSNPGAADLVIELTRGGFFNLGFRVMGTPVTININDLVEETINAPPYLSEYPLTPQLLHTGQNRIAITFPPGGGIDSIILDGRQDNQDSLARLLGLDILDPKPTPADLDALSGLLAAFGPTH